MARKTKNRGVLEVLKNGPEHSYGSESPEEMECCKLAEQWLLEAKEPIEYRKDLLNTLIRFKERVSADGEALNNAGEGS